MAAALASAGAAVLYATPELTREEILARAAARHPDPAADQLGGAYQIGDV